VVLRPVTPVHENVVLFEMSFYLRGGRRRHAALHYDAGAARKVRV